MFTISLSVWKLEPKPKNSKMQSYISYTFKRQKSFLPFVDIMNKKPRLAWELYLKMETSGESFSLLQLIANDCYKVSLSES